MEPSAPQNGIHIAATAQVSDDARIIGSDRGTTITIGEDTRIASFAVIRCVGGDGGIVIGARCYINESCVLYSGAGITLGDDVLIGPGSVIAAAEHIIPAPGTTVRGAGFESSGGVVIGDDVWLGANVTVLDGAQIGAGAIIAAGSVVRGVVPVNQIWGGVPARYLKDRE